LYFFRTLSNNTKIVSLKIQLAPLPINSIEWYINGIIIHPNQKYNVSFIDNETTSLEINDLNLLDAGEYCCKIVTNQGVYRSTCFLNIERSKLI
jgi:hypothetical protein